MPFALHRPCRSPGCPALVVAGAGSYCPTHRRQATVHRAAHDRQRGTAAARGYDAEWARYRRLFLAQYPLCPGVLMPTDEWTIDAAKEFHAERERRRELGEILWLSALSPQPSAFSYRPWGVGAAAVVVDHIVPHKGDHELMWAPWNHQPLTKRAHDRKTATEQKRGLRAES